jgi:hypothetical protein
MPNDIDGQHERIAIDGRGAWLQSVRALLVGAPDSGLRELVLVDASFDAWPLGEPEVIEAMTHWLRQPGRRLRLAGLSFDGMQVSQPRFATWRRNWTHAIDVVSPLEVPPADMPCLLVSAQPPLVLELFDRERFRGRLTRDPREARLATDRVAALLQRSEPSWPANALGL